MNGQLPETNIEQFRMFMNLIGMHEKVLKPMKHQERQTELDKSLVDEGNSSSDSESE